MAARILFPVILVCAVITCSVGITFCPSTSTTDTFSSSFEISTATFYNEQSWGIEEKCQCTIRSIGGTAFFERVYDLRQPEEAEDSTNKTCGPLLATQHLGALTFTCASSYSQTPSDNTDNDEDTEDNENEMLTNDDKDHKNSLFLEENDSLVLYLHNPSRKSVKARVAFNPLIGGSNVQVTCAPPSEIISYKSCPCASQGAPSTDLLIFGTDVPISKRFMVAIICVVLFLLACACIFVGYYYYKKRYEGDKDLEDASHGRTVEGSQNNGFDNPQMAPDADNMYTHVTDGKPVPFEPDPSLKLDMQIPTHTQGSTDSGLYSIPDKPANNALGPDQMYTGAPGGPPMNHHPEQQLSPEEISAMYAKPNKPHPPPISNIPKNPPNIEVNHAPATLPPMQSHAPVTLPPVRSHAPATLPPASHQNHAPDTLPVSYSRPVHQGMRAGSRDRLNHSRDGIDNEMYVTDSSFNTSKGSIQGLNTTGPLVETDV